LMLFSMAIYLLSMDEAWRPFGGRVPQQVPHTLEGGD
jgi:hypothetical protein